MECPVIAPPIGLWYATAKLMGETETFLVEKGKSHSKEGLTYLLTCAQQGQREAREEIFFFLRTRFLVLAKLRLMEEDAQDVVQETLMVVDDHFSELETAESLLAFTNEVMRNKIGNFYQKRNRRMRYQAEWEEVPEPTYYMDGELDAAELARIMRKAIDQLGEKNSRCRAILLGLCEGLSLSELSQRLQLPRPRIDDWVFRCRKELRRILSDDYGLRV